MTAIDKAREVLAEYDRTEDPNSDYGIQDDLAEALRALLETLEA